MNVLGIETTCDETSAAVFDGSSILSNVIFSQVLLHSRFKGVVPELASRAHMERAAGIIKQALEQAEKKSGGRIDLVAFARGPGLPGALLVGRVAAETSARVLGTGLIGVNHLEGHLLACELDKDGAVTPLEFPLIALIVSGGHTELWLARGYGRYVLLGKTRDDAAGEAFDKVAKLLGLGYPGGPAVERAALCGGKDSIKFPRPFLEGTWDFSFSGLKTAVAYYLRDAGFDRKLKSPKIIGDICASFQSAAVETLSVKAVKAAKKLGIYRIAVGGGVAANSELRSVLAGRAKAEGLKVRFASRRFCMDNAAMIALAGYRKFQHAGRGCLGGRIFIDPELKI